MQYKAARWAGRSPRIVPLQSSARQEQSKGQGAPHSGKPSCSPPLWSTVALPAHSSSSPEWAARTLSIQASTQEYTVGVEGDEG